MSTRFGFVSTFPPTQCGLATFTAALRDALLHSTTDEGWVVRLVDAPAPRSGDEVVAQLITDDSASLRRAAAQLNLCDVAIVQHEYGVYGGADGSQILHLLDQVWVPCVIVLHTVLTDPTPHQRQVLESVMARADAVVAMTMTARERLAAGYAVDMTKVCVIAHGAPAMQTTMAEPTFRTGQFTVLTWGLLGPGLGVAATSAQTPGMRARALGGFRIAAQCRSPHVRSMAFAALGAAELLRKRPDEMAARRLLTDTLAVIGGAEDDDSLWPWPEERLSYANASIAEALIVAGDALPDMPALSRGLSLLEFLLRTETRDEHLSVTPVGGRGRDDAGPGFDQQPIEVSALADACGSAFVITQQSSWLSGVSLAWDWFLGYNDSATPMFDPRTGGGYDGLQRGGRNLNQGAESTLAMLATAQQARRIGEPA